MLEYNIPGRGKLTIRNLLIDYNGTLAYKGKIDDSTKKMIERLNQKVNVYIATADTYETVRDQFKNSKVNLKIIDKKNGKDDKQKLIEELGINKTIAIGNGANDKKMIQKACLGIVILGPEGCSTK
ncbi:MAG: HAD family hydrolase, partial [Halanaerobiales bacterium]